MEKICVHRVSLLDCARTKIERTEVWPAGGNSLEFGLLFPDSYDSRQARLHLTSYSWAPCVVLTSTT